MQPDDTVIEAVYWNKQEGKTLLHTDVLVLGHDFPLLLKL